MDLSPAILAVYGCALLFGAYLLFVLRGSSEEFVAPKLPEPPESPGRGNTSPSPSYALPSIRPPEGTLASSTQVYGELASTGSDEATETATGREPPEPGEVDRSELVSGVAPSCPDDAAGRAVACSAPAGQGIVLRGVQCSPAVCNATAVPGAAGHVQEHVGTRARTLGQLRMVLKHPTPHGAAPLCHACRGNPWDV